MRAPLKKEKNMAINIFEVEPHVVSNDLTGYIVGIYGAPGCGDRFATFK